MLGSVNYSPCLFTRVAEIKALRELPGLAKDKMFPILSCRPWPNANLLERTWEKISEAIPERRFALDLDESKFNAPSKKQAARDFDELFDCHNGYESFYTAVSKVPFAVPVIRTTSDQVPDLDKQLGHIEKVDRGAVLRIRRLAHLNPVDLVDQVAGEIAGDLVLVLDAGWSNDLLSKETWFDPVIRRVADLAPEAEIIVTGSSFPDSFSNVSGLGEKFVEERAVYDGLVRRHNAAKLIYGDWGSTREPRDPVPMRNIPRIDIAEANRWLFYRSEEDDERYIQLAEYIVNDPVWGSLPDIWVPT